MIEQQTGDTGAANETPAADVSGGESGGLDINAAVDSIGNDLFGKKGDVSAPDEPVTDDEPVVEAAAETEGDKPDTETADDTEQTAQTEVQDFAPPKSWAKDKHEVWAKMPAEAKEYYLQREQQMLDGLEQYKGDATFGRPLKEVITPYMPMIQARGIDAPKAVAALLNAQYQLDRNPVEGILHIAKSYGVDLGQLAQQFPNGAPQVAPEVLQLREELHGIKTELSQREQQDFQARQQKVAAEVTAFANDPKHPYFNDVADDIALRIKAGEPLNYATYEKAVWANPVTRAKELARVAKEQADKLRGKNKVEAQVARKATSSNVRSRDTSRAPTEAIGTMEDTMKETLRNMRQRTH